MAMENLFLVLNLGCEMLYVIDQRLKAQKVSVEKSAKVLRDITEVLLDHKFLNYVTTCFEKRLLTAQQAKFLLSEAACCSLMRLDPKSMGKLWDLMVMLLKYQLFLVRNSVEIMDLTFRHLDGITRLMPEMRKTILVDATKQILIDYWDVTSEEERYTIHCNLAKWLMQFNSRVSILLRLGLQRNDGQFVENPKGNEFFVYYRENNGTNIYAKTAHISSHRSSSGKEANDEDSAAPSREFDTLFAQLNIPKPSSSFNFVNLPLSSTDNLGEVDLELGEEEEEFTNLEMFLSRLKAHEGTTSNDDES